MQYSRRGYSHPRDRDDRVGAYWVFTKTNQSNQETMPYSHHIFIEGYTALEREFPKVVLRTDGLGKITQPGMSESRQDARIFKKYPLWQDYSGQRPVLPSMPFALPCEK